MRLDPTRKEDFIAELLQLLQQHLEKTGQGEGAFARSLSMSDALFKNLRKGSMPSVDRLSAILEEIGETLVLGNADTAPAPQSVDTPATRPQVNKIPFGDKTIPHHGLAKCSIRGWGKDQINLAPLPRPDFINDPDAFYVSAIGQSMEQEGIISGDFCLVSPAQDISEGDRIWLTDRNGLTSIKRLEKMSSDTLVLRGWQPIEGGKQTNFHDKIKTNFIKQAHPVVAVFRGKPGQPNSTFIADPMNDEPQLIASTVPDEFATIRLHDTQLAADDGRQSWGDGPTSAIAFPKAWLRQRGISPSAASLVWVTGDSMIPTLKSGSMVMLDHNHRTPKGRRIYAFRQGENLRVKRLEWLTDNQLLISSDNPTHQTEFLAGPDLNDLEVLGEVVWSGAPIS